MSKKRMTGGEAVIATLEAHGVDTVFGIPGGHSLAIYDALAKGSSIRHILGRHEQGLAFMADGYARASGRIGVVTTTSGPAVANLACGMGEATTDTSPVLAIASTVRSDLVGRDRGGLHDCAEAIDIMRPVCRYVRRSVSVEEIPGTIADLIYDLRANRPGGAYCEIPRDILGAEAEVEIPAPAAVERAQPEAGQLEKAVRLLADAQRPVIWAGTGATVSGAGEEIADLAARLGALVVPTTLGRGIIPSDHPNAVAVDGAWQTGVTDLISEADVVLAVGTMFKQEDTASWSVKLGERLIHIDIDPEEIGRSYEPEVGIVADAKAALAAILGELPARAPADLAWVARGKQAEAENLRQRREIGPTEMQALDILRAAVPRDGVMVCDRCSLGYWAYRSGAAYAPRTFQYPMGYGALGGALPQSLGAKVACPDKDVVCIIGDGGFQFTATELAVAMQESIPVTIILCNNGAYGAIRANQDRNFGGRRFGCTLANPSFEHIAAAYGVSYARADSLDAFEQALARGIRSEELNMIDLTLELRDP